MSQLSSNLIPHLGSNLGVGDTLRDDCPRCGGQGTFTVTRTEDGLVWNCYRASCTLRGGSGASTPAPTSSKPTKKRRVWSGKTHEIPPSVATKLRAMWRIDPPPDTWWWTTDYGGRVAMSIRGPKYGHRGWVLRSITGGEPKALTFVDEGEEGISWYKTTPGAGTILVEDIPSAVRAAARCNSVALCGTGIGHDRAAEIAEYATRPIIVALDQDATKLSFKWARKYALMWGDVKVQLLNKDIKDMTDEELTALLG